MTKILAGERQSGTGVGAYFGRPAAGKTGTTENHADAWFCGYTPQLEATVWVGYQQSRDPDVQRARHLGRGRDVPGDDLAPLHGARRSRAGPTAGLPVPKHDTRPSTTGTAEWQYDRRRRSDQTHDRLLATRRPRPHVPADELARRPRSARRGRRRPRPDGGRRPARVAGRVAARAAERRPSRRRLDLRVDLPRAARRRVRRLRRRRRARARGAAAARRRRGARVRDPARAARRAAAALDRRVDVLGLRADRGRARREPVPRRRRATSRTIRRFRYVGAGWRDTTTVYGPAFTLASEPLARAAGHVGRRGGVDLQDARGRGVLACGGARRAALARGPRSRSRSSAGTRCSPCTSRGGGHNDAWVALLVLGALAAAAARPAAARRASLGARRSREVGAARAAAAARARGARDAAAASGTSASPSPRSSSRSRRSALRHRRGCTRSGRSRGTRTTRRAGRCRTGSSSSASRTASRSRSSRRVRSSRTRGSCARRGAAARASASRRARSCSRRRTSSSGTSCGRVPLAAAEDDEPAALLVARAVRVPAAPDDSALGRQDAVEDEHAVLLEHEPPRRVAPQPDDLRRRRQRREPVRVAGLRLVDGDPLRVLDVREAEHARARGEMRAERVRRADDRVRRDQRAARAPRRGRARSRPPRATAASRRPGSSLQSGIAPRR